MGAKCSSAAGDPQARGACDASIGVCECAALAVPSADGTVVMEWCGAACARARSYGGALTQRRACARGQVHGPRMRDGRRRAAV